MSVIMRNGPKDVSAESPLHSEGEDHGRSEGRRLDAGDRDAGGGPDAGEKTSCARCWRGWPAASMSRRSRASWGSTRRRLSAGGGVARGSASAAGVREGDQFAQSTVDKDDFFAMIEAMNALTAKPRKESELKEAFEAFWPRKLGPKIAELITQPAKPREVTQPPEQTAQETLDWAPALSKGDSTRRRFARRRSYVSSIRMYEKVMGEATPPLAQLRAQRAATEEAIRMSEQLGVSRN